MLFWLVLHSLQLSDAKAAEPGFSGEKWTPSCRIRSSPNTMKIYGDRFYGNLLGITEDGGEGTHQAARRVPGAAPLLAVPGTLLDAWWPPSVPLSPIRPPWGENPKRRRVSVLRRRHGAETYRGENPSPAGRFRRGDHLPKGEIVAIIIITGIIEIIPNISTISISMPSHLTIATCV